MWGDPAYCGPQMIEIMCGACNWKTTNLHFLHIHLTSHTEGGNYMYHHAAKTAFPVNHLVSSFTQTERTRLVENASQTDESYIKECNLQSLFEGSGLSANGQSLAPGFGSSGFTDSSPLVDNASQTDESYIKECNLQSLFDHSAVVPGFGSSEYTDNKSIFPGNEFAYDPVVVKTEAGIQADDENEMDADATTFPVTAIGSSNSDTATPNKKGRRIKITPKRKRQANSTKGKCKHCGKASPKRQKKADVGGKAKKNKSAAAAGEDSFDGNTDMGSLEDFSMEFLESNLTTQGQAQADASPVRKKKKRKPRVSYTTVQYEPPKILIQCHICHRQCRKRANMCQHIESQHAGQYYWKCGSCRVPFVSEGDYLHHVKQCKDSWAKCHSCSECHHQKVFLSKKLFLEHLRERHGNFFPLNCSVCNVSIPSEFDEKEHMSEHDKEALKCRFCETVSKSKIESEIHMMSHVRENPYTCYICDKVFINLKSVQGHVYTHLDDDGGDRGTYVCEKCGASFTHSTKRFNHWRNCRKCYKCKVCGLVLPSIHHLKQHKVIHDETKKFVCDQCGDAFSYQYDLNRHVKRLHSTDPTSVGFTCTLCNSFFMSKTSLDSHILSHENILPYSCEYCKRNFRDKKSLQRHARQHTGEKPYVCSRCGLAFAHNVSRKNHESKCGNIYM